MSRSMLHLRIVFCALPLSSFRQSDKRQKQTRRQTKKSNKKSNNKTMYTTQHAALTVCFFCSSFFFVQTIRKTANTKSNKKANKEIKRKKTCNDYQKNKQTKQTKKQCMTLSMLHLRFVFFALLHLSSCRQPVSVIKGNQTKSKKQQHMHTKRQR